MSIKNSLKWHKFRHLRSNYGSSLLNAMHNVVSPVSKGRELPSLVESAGNNYYYLSYYVTGYEKRDHFVHFRNFHLKRLYLWNHSSYELQTWYEYSYIHHPATLLQIASPTHIWCGRGERPHRSRSKIAVLCLTLAAHHLGQKPCCSF